MEAAVSSKQKAPKAVDRDAFMAREVAKRVAKEAGDAKEIRISLDSGFVINAKTVLGYILISVCVLCAVVQTVFLVCWIAGVEIGLGLLLSPLWIFLVTAATFLVFWTLLLWTIKVAKRIEARYRV